MSGFKVLSCWQKILYLAFLIAQFTPSDWQASGNMTDYLPTIRGFMDAAIEDSLSRSAIAKNISDSCNAVWDQFWNVFVLWLRDPSSDAILYGYAFRSHWYWHNNYSKDQQSFIIWKDYNCKEKYSEDGTLQQEKVGTSNAQTAMQAAYSANNDVVNDIWQWAHDAVQNHLTDIRASQIPIDRSKLSLTVVLANQIPSQYSFRICRLGVNVYATDLVPKTFYLQGYTSRLDSDS